jgi:hypothetical protein
METEFVERDDATRFKVCALAGALLLLLLLEHLTSPSATSRAADPVRAFQKSVGHLLIVALTAVPLFAGVSIYLIRLGVKVGRSGQYPPPGMRVAVRAQILRGRRATWNAILIFVLAGILMVPGPALIYAWYSLSHLAIELNQPNKQMQPSPRNSGATDLRR